jgi:hypothetical protein
MIFLMRHARAKSLTIIPGRTPSGARMYFPFAIGRFVPQIGVEARRSGMQARGYSWQVAEEMARSHIRRIGNRCFPFDFGYNLRIIWEFYQ